MTPHELRLAFDAYRHQQERADFRAGIIAATIANANRDPKKRKRPYRPQDFLPRYGRSVQTPEQQLRVIELLNAALGGEDRRRG
ncbi:MAG: hypothetical protein ACM3ZA_01010 [Bacillota bacterium]